MYLHNKQSILHNNYTQLLVQSYVYAHNLMTTLHVKVMIFSFQHILTTALRDKHNAIIKYNI
jgi:hypothetical protein